MKLIHGRFSVVVTGLAFAVSACADAPPAPRTMLKATYPSSVRSTWDDSPALSPEARRLVLSVSWAGRAHNAGVRAVMPHINPKLARQIGPVAVCSLLDEQLSRHFEAAGDLTAAGPTARRAYRVGHEATLENLNCTPRHRDASQSLFRATLGTPVTEDSIMGPIVLAPETEGLVAQIESATLNATTQAGLESALIPILNQAAMLDSLSSHVVGAAASVAVESWVGWTGYYSGGGGGGDSLPNQMSVFGSFRQESQAGHLGKADVAGGVSALAVGCVRFWYIAAGCATPQGVVGIFVAGAVGVSLYEWLMT